LKVNAPLSRVPRDTGHLPADKIIDLFEQEKLIPNVPRHLVDPG
jgi:hypothetical protein